MKNSDDASETRRYAGIIKSIELGYMHISPAAGAQQERVPVTFLTLAYSFDKTSRGEFDKPEKVLSTAVVEIPVIIGGVFVNRPCSYVCWHRKEVINGSNKDAWNYDLNIFGLAKDSSGRLPVENRFQRRLIGFHPPLFQSTGLVRGFGLEAITAVPGRGASSLSTSDLLDPTIPDQLIGIVDDEGELRADESQLGPGSAGENLLRKTERRAAG